MNFIFPVPDASVPAVDICSDKSEAGITRDKEGRERGEREREERERGTVEREGRRGGRGKKGRG